MKIKRPLINQLYEEDSQEPDNQAQQPLERPMFAQPKQSAEVTAAPMVEPVQVAPAGPEPEEKFVQIQTKPSEAFLKAKAEAEAKSKMLAEQQRIKNELAIQEENKKHEQIYRQKPVAVNNSVKPEPILALPKTAVQTQALTQKQRIIKKVEALAPLADQLEFSITPKKVTFKQRFEFFKVYFERRQELLEISMMWKNPALPFTIISLISVIGLLFFGGIFEFDKIPLKIPLFYNHVQKSWEQADKSTMFIIGIILLVTESILINIITKIFKSDRRLALTISWMITFINVLIIIATLQIYTLIS